MTRTRAPLVGLGLGFCLLIASPVTAQGVNGLINAPGPNSTVMQPFTVTGWAIHGPGAGTGIDIVRVYGCTTTCVLWGTATYGVARPDVAAAYGAQYLHSGYTFTKAGLTPGPYYLQIQAHSTVTGNWFLWGHAITVQAGPEHTLQFPTQGQSVTSPVSVSGWAIDASAPSGTGVNLVGVWSYPNPGSGTPPAPVNPNAGAATYGGNRADVAASHGERFRYSGYTHPAALSTGQHLLGVQARSSHTQVLTVRTRTIYVNIATVPLAIDRPGTGTGGVTASGLSCPGGSPTQALPCGASYPLHTVVTLTAAPDPGSTFDGWGGACAGTGTCQVTMANARYVTAAFAKIPNTIATRYYHTDVVGSVRAITDETGAVVIRHDYRPFGEDTQPLSGDPNRFAGKQLDAETAMHYFDARYYRQTWGRFSTVDPLHVGIAMTDPQQWNRYAYARNNPARYRDSTGLFVDGVLLDVFWRRQTPVDLGSSNGRAAGAAALVPSILDWLFGGGGSRERPSPFDPGGPPQSREGANGNASPPTTGQAQGRAELSLDIAGSFVCRSDFVSRVGFAAAGLRTKQAGTEFVIFVTGTPSNPRYSQPIYLPPGEREDGLFGGRVLIPDGTFLIIHSHPDGARRYDNGTLLSPQDERASNNAGIDFIVVSDYGLEFYDHGSGAPKILRDGNSWRSRCRGL